MEDCDVGVDTGVVVDCIGLASPHRQMPIDPRVMGKTMYMDGMAHRIKIVDITTCCPVGVRRHRLHLTNSARTDFLIFFVLLLSFWFP